MVKYTIDKRFSPFFKERGKDRLGKLLGYAGIESNPNVWFGSRLLTVLLFGMVGVLIPFSLFPYLDLKDFGLLADTSFTMRLFVSFAFGLAFSLAASLLIYMHLYYLINERAQRVDAILPDFLLMVSANLRSGMTPYAAFQSSARPEFGPLQTEIIYVSSISMGNESFSEALKELTATIDSTILRRVVVFFENGLKAGGKLAYLLETSAEEIRETEEMKRQMMINAKTYAVFVAFILVLGLPLLLAISTQFITVFSKVQGSLGGGSAGAGASMAGLPAPKMNIDVKFIDQLSYILIIGNSIFTAILVGIISRGKVLFGLKYAPPLAFAALFFFFIFKTVIGGFLSALA
ncbi:MAG: type II secretion system F family protein [Candidatus Micrarchaeota archaeon]|nr:type II secretion system F family protein [Candidatus Micrarchaeota archaeon]